jgi:hypothetical protein
LTRGGLNENIIEDPVHLDGRKHGLEASTRRWFPYMTSAEGSAIQRVEIQFYFLRLLWQAVVYLMVNVKILMTETPSATLGGYNIF